MAAAALAGGVVISIDEGQSPRGAYVDQPLFRAMITSRILAELDAVENALNGAGSMFRMWAKGFTLRKADSARGSTMIPWMKRPPGTVVMNNFGFNTKIYENLL